MTERDGGFTHLGLAPGDYYAQVDSAQLIRLNWHTSPENIEFKIEPDFLGDIVYDLEFLLTKNDERAEKQFPGQDESNPTKTTRSASETEQTQADIAPENPLKNEIKDSPEQITDAITYSIQFGAFKNQQNAKGLAESFNNSFEIPVVIDYEEGLYKVRTGNFKNRFEAEKQIEFYKSKGLSCFLVAKH
jgi:hypothetical protein